MIQEALDIEHSDVSILQMENVGCERGNRLLQGCRRWLGGRGIEAKYAQNLGGGKCERFPGGFDDQELGPLRRRPTAWDPWISQHLPEVHAEMNATFDGHESEEHFVGTMRDWPGTTVDVDAQKCRGPQSQTFAGDLENDERFHRRGMLADGFGELFGPLFQIARWRSVIE